MQSGDTSLGGSRGAFPDTTLGLFSRLGDPSDPERRAAFESLCRRYWKPVYRYLRIAWAKSNEDAKDLTQAFFLWALEDESLVRYAPEKGSFRRYLKVLLSGFVTNADKYLGRLKRGGGQKVLTLDDETSALKEAIPDAQAVSPEQAFDREWMRTIVKRAVDGVRQRFASTGREAQFRVYEALELGPDSGRETYAQVGARMNLKEGEVRRYLFVAREAVREELRAELTRTTMSRQALEEEWNDLFGS